MRQQQWSFLQCSASHSGLASCFACEAVRPPSWNLSRNLKQNGQWWWRAAPIRSSWARSAVPRARDSRLDLLGASDALLAKFRDEDGALGKFNELLQRSLVFPRQPVLRRFTTTRNSKKRNSYIALPRTMSSAGETVPSAQRNISPVHDCPDPLRDGRRSLHGRPGHPPRAARVLLVLGSGGRCRCACERSR